MDLLNMFKLEKVKILVLDKDRKEKGQFEFMFNPNSYSKNLGNKFTSKPAIGGQDAEKQFANTNAERLSLELIIDGTGVADFGFETILGIGSPTVPETIETFKYLCLEINEEWHEPNILQVVWGKETLIEGRLESVDITYTLFDNTGVPLRAKLNATFIEDKSFEKAARTPELHSPDVFRVREVKMEDTLPLMAKDIYGSFDHYIWLARKNDLDQFRKLTPGTTILFPPLER